MKTIQAMIRIGLSVVLLAAVVLAAGAMPAAAQTSLPDCGGLPECDYIQMHSYEPYQQVYVPGIYAEVRRPSVPGILPSGVTCTAEQLYVGQGYHLEIGCGGPFFYRD